MKLFSAGSSILDRYQAHGIPYEMEEDKVVIAGPSWLEFGLKYEPVMNGDQTGKVHKRSIHSRDHRDNIR